MNKLKLIFCFSVSIFSLSTHAANFILESGVMDWSQKAEDSFGKQRSENAFIKVHGSNATDFGDIYGNVLIEDPDDQEEMGIEVVLIGQANLPNSDFNFYSQVYVKNEPDWSETIILPGVSWDKVFENGLYFQSAATLNYVIADYRGLGIDGWENGYNGLYFTITTSKDFSLFDQDFSVMWTQEHYIFRDELYTSITREEKSFGFNGWLVIDWHILKQLSAAISYRYSNNNMGVKGYSDGVFYSLKYSF
ncbi:hypothetical protein E2650_05920 [Shewanella xiamenensis]|uniref:Ion channel protein Tsx n=1 Tax=Shewanella xiamenensis TaxID=332186 RepID=A0AAW6QUU8_9GAMM|nr:outer membrane protein OmpK [Shewanella xiamenensis]MDG5899448.1 hypothetical protein [Shewanella xiamenensis]